MCMMHSMALPYTAEIHFEIKVAGDATVTFNMCQYGGDSTAKIVALKQKR